MNRSNRWRFELRRHTDKDESRPLQKAKELPRLGRDVYHAYSHEKTLLNNRIGNYLTSDFADLPSVDTDNIINTEYDCTAAGKEENNAAKN